ncbi:UNVERIFIED_CONTAM: hypothetical protein PYX00_000837 [Menopon gallinae]|uniref:LHFPL tetraspan subfamily member 3 protein n=1 Tax=Menopon gallinae TaxID=328185 RepID=A0AAW2IA45_9NEOP
MGSKIEYVESSHVYVTNYVRNSKAVGVLWGIFTICYAIIIIVAFVTPEWIGDTSASESPGRFGLWTRCFFRGSNELSGIGVEECIGKLDDFSGIVHVAFKAATVFVGLSAVISLVTICTMLLFFFFASTTVFYICGWLQLLSALFLIVGVLTYPAGWDAPEVQQICGPTASSYHLGECGIRWSYLLAVIGCFDALILSSLAFILATKHVKLQSDQGHPQNGQVYKGDMNGPYICDTQSLAGSRKSLNIHPVLMMPQPSDMDRYSEFSNRTGRTKSSAYRPSYPSSIQNFQL